MQGCTRSRKEDKNKIQQTSAPYAHIIWKDPPDSRESIESYLENDPILYLSYRHLTSPYRERLLDFLRGARTLPLTYDPFFKTIFDPVLHPERLSGLISSLLGIPVKVKDVLPTEDRMLDGESLLIMDVLVELEDGSLTNVEIQKIPYAFPAERMSCYSSDLVMRQYARAKSLRGKDFSYRDMRKVYTIILFENSAHIFHQNPDHYIHHGKTSFDTGLQMTLLQEYCLVALDVFRKKPYSENRSKQTAWLSLLTTETIEDAEKLITVYPWLEDIYKEIAMLRQKPEEVLHMFSEALKIMDRNTVHYMIEEQQKELEEQLKKLKEQQKKSEEQQKELEEQQKELEEQQKLLSVKDQEIETQRREIETLKKQIAALKAQEI